MEVNKSLQGLQSRRAGQYFEEIVIRTCEWYRVNGIARIEKTPEPVRILSKMDAKGTFRACFEKAAQPDFKGTLKGGRAVCFECKHTDTDKIQKSRMTAEQTLALEDHTAFGAMTFVLCSFRMLNFYRVPFSVWEAMEGVFGRKYLTEEDLINYRVPVVNGRIDFLAEEEEING